MKKIWIAVAISACIGWPAYSENLTVSPASSGGGGSGTVTSVAAGCGGSASPNPITSTGTISASETVNAQTGTSYAILNADCGGLTTFSNGSSIAVTIAQAGAAGSFASGWFADYRNKGAGLVTITPATSTIDGAATITLAQGAGFRIVSDGANYQVTLKLATVATSASASDLTSGALAVARIGTGAASHAVPVDVAGTSTYKVLPDCTDTGGNHINYTQSTDAFSCGTSGGGSVTLNAGYQTGQYILGFGVGTSSAGATFAANTIVCSFRTYLTEFTIDTLSTRVTILAVGGSAQYALYTNINGRPGSLLSSTGSISTTTVAAVTGTLGASQQVGPGSTAGANIWICRNYDTTAAATTTTTGIPGTDVLQASLIGTSTLANATNSGSTLTVGVSCAGANCTGGSSTFNTWPASLAGSTFSDVNTGASPWAAAHAASVP